MGADQKNTNAGNTRQPQQQQGDKTQSKPMQQNQQGQAGQKSAGQGGRIDTDGDGRTRDPRDTRPNDQGGRKM
jgi:hypothetical protein